MTRGEVDELRVVVLASGTGSLLQALLDARDTAPYRIVAVGSDRRQAYALERARATDTPTFVHPYRKGSDRDAWDARLTDLVDRHRPDLVVSAGFMKLVGRRFLDRYAGRMINTHPALLPAFPGMHGPRDALAYGVKVTGATVFVVDHGVDTGAIVAQRPVDVHADDTVATLHERIKVVERTLLVEVVADFAAHRLPLPYAPRTREAPLPMEERPS